MIRHRFCKIIELIFLLLILAVFMEGCSIAKIYYNYYPYDSVENRTHESGVRIYNNTGDNLSEEWWKSIFSSVSLAEEGFRECIKANEEDGIFKQVLILPIVVLPETYIRILGKDQVGFTTLDMVFLSKRFFSVRNLKHEWTHIYLYLTGKRILGDIFHRDRMFVECSGNDYMF